MKNLLVIAAAAAVPLTLAACGGANESAPPAAKMSPAQARPAAPVAASTIGTIARTDEGSKRIGLVDLTRDAQLETPLPADELRNLVLGGEGASRAGAAVAEDGATVAVQIADATLTQGASGRTVEGGTAQLRTALERTKPSPNAGEDETSAATQACLGDSVAQVIWGPRELGFGSAVGVGLADALDAPRGPQLRVCVAAFRVKALHDAEQRLAQHFPTDGIAKDRQPVVAEQEIGERHMLGASVALDQLSASELRAWLRGGERVKELARYVPGKPGDDGEDLH